MKVSREEFARNRERIEEAAGRLFRERGYDGVGIADITAAAGLTHGAFYRHFASKDDLVAAVTRGVLASNVARWQRAASENARDPRKGLVDRYLSERHRDAAGRGCLIAAVAGEVARGSPARAEFTAGLRSLVDALSAVSPGRTATVRERNALATLATMVGGLVLARGVDDAGLSSRILDAARHSLTAAVPRA